MQKSKMITVHLVGRRPLMFDRYAGDNNTQLPVAEKMYLDAQRRLILPAINVFSMLAAENTKSVTKQFFGKQGRSLAQAIMAYTSVEPDDIPILDGDEKPITWNGEFGEQMYVSHHVARLPKGIPNPKERPTLALPWQLKFAVIYMENPTLSINTLEDAYRRGGSVGFGTFRPMFGRYEVVEFSY
jgi:hypothetical protein